MSIITRLKSKRWRYLLTQSKVTVEPGGELIVGNNVSITKSVIYISQGSVLTIGDDTHLHRSVIYTAGSSNTINIGSNNHIDCATVDSFEGSCSIGNHNIISSSADGHRATLRVHNGSLTIGNYNRLRCVVWLRFGGVATIGDRNAINQRSEIRCDHSVEVGSYNQISYDCVIWDTNTHCIYPAHRRRQITDEQYPAFGLEVESPKCAPVHIGSDCWIARGVSVLKGVTLRDSTIVGYGTTIPKGEFPSNSVIRNNCTVVVTTNNIT